MKVAIRADGSTAIGMGHIYNSLAVAEILREYGLEIYYITKDFSEAVGKLQELSYAVEKISPHLDEKRSFAETIDILKKKKTKFLITDLLEIHHDCSAELRKDGIRCISFDILGKIALKSDIIFNRTTLTKRFTSYIENGYTKYYLGPKYVPLTKQFWGSDKKPREIKQKAEKALICLGGGDEFNITARVAKILDDFLDLDTTLILGKAFKAEKELQQTISEMKKNPIVLTDVSNMAELLLQTDIAICAGGSILYELAITGTPAVIIPMNGHQVENGEEFQALGSVITLGMHSDVSDEKIAASIRKLTKDNFLREKMSLAGKKITDGRGAERIAGIIYDFVKNNGGEDYWHRLEQEVIKPSLCTQCGSCVGLSKGLLEFRERKGIPLPTKTNKAGAMPKLSYYACPARYCDYPSLNQFVFGKLPENWLSGVLEKSYIGYSLDQSIRRNGASGGVITNVLVYLLETGKIKGAVCLKVGEKIPYKAEPIIARTKEEVIACAQSVYSVTPTNVILSQLEKEEGPFAYVGLPDQVASVRKLQKLGHKGALKIKYVLGLYMGTQMYFEAIRSFLRSHEVKSEEEIVSLKYRAGEWPGYLQIELKDGRVLKAEKFYYNYLIPFFITFSSLQLVDFTNELTDISVGDAWHSKYEKQGQGFSVVLARSKQGEELLLEMKEKNLISLKELPLDKALEMHGHMLDFKKRGSFIRNSWKKAMPEYGYHPAQIPVSRYCVEYILALIFVTAKTKTARWAVEHLPILVVGPAFNILRKKWKNFSKPAKRKGLKDMKFIVTEGREN